MSIQFPDTPTQGDSFVATNGVSYTYDNGGWIANSQSALDDRFVNLDGDQMTGDLTVPSLNGGQLAGFRNQIINGDFRIWQRGDGPTFTEDASSNFYAADRWYLIKQSGDTVDVTKRIFSNNITVTGGPVNYCRVNVGTASNVVQFVQRIEGVTTLQGGQATVSFWSRGSAARNITMHLVQVKEPSDVISTAKQTVAITTGSWVFHTCTFDVPNVVSDLSTLSSGNYLGLQITLSGDTLPNQTGWTDFANVQLEPGPVATPFEHRPIATELALCQRYYLKAPYDGSGRVGGTSRNFMIFKSMRAIPTVTNDVGSCKFFDGNNTLRTETVAENTVAPSSTLDYSINAVRLVIPSTNYGTSSTNLPCGIYIPEVTLDAEL